MADILIRGMEMPEKCDKCKVAMFCLATSKPTIPMQIWMKTRPDWCPLVSLQEGHGRLIDGTDLYAVLDGGFDVDLDELPETKAAILSMIQSAETIVPAEGGGEE